MQPYIGQAMEALEKSCRQIYIGADAPGKREE